MSNLINRFDARRRGRRGFSLMETMMVTLVVAIAAVVVIPGAAAEDPITIQSVGANLSADLEYAQSATVSNPTDPTVVVIDVLNNRYYVAMASRPDTPIDRPGAPAGTKYEAKLGDAAGTTSLDLTTQGVGSYIRFDAMGRLQQESDVVLTLSNGSGAIEIFISATTGSVSAVSDASDDVTITTQVYVDPDFNPLNPVVVPTGGGTSAPKLDPTLSLSTDAAAGDDATDPSLVDDLVDTVDGLIGGTLTASTTSTNTGTVGGVTVGVSTSPVTSTVETVTTTTTSTVRSLLR